MEKYDKPFPDETKNKIFDADAILLGAVGGESMINCQKKNQKQAY